MNSPIFFITSRCDPFWSVFLFSLQKRHFQGLTGPGCRLFVEAVQIERTQVQSKNEESKTLSEGPTKTETLDLLNCNSCDLHAWINPRQQTTLSTLRLVLIAVPHFTVFHQSIFSFIIFIIFIYFHSVVRRPSCEGSAKETTSLNVKAVEGHVAMPAFEGPPRTFACLRACPFEAPVVSVSLFFKRSRR